MKAARLHAMALGDAIRRLAAQPWASLFSIAVLGLAIALPVIAAVALRSASAVAASFDADPHLDVYLALDAGDEDVRRTEQQLKALPDVAAVKFVPRAQAFDELRATTHLAEILATLDRNPLPHAFTVRLKGEALERGPALREALSKWPKVDQVAADFDWSRKLGRWVRFGDRLLGIGAAVLAAAVLFIVGHLIRLQAVTRREEIHVSQLVGATAADVRRPLLYHGLLQGVLSGTVGLAVAAGLAAWLGAEMLALAPGYGTELKVLFLLPTECVAVVASAGLLGWLAAWMAATREIRRFSAA